MRIWAFHNPDDVFYLQNLNEVNGIKVSFTIGNQTPSQVQSIVLIGDHGVVSMDTTFGTNDVKFHLFTLMVFDAHHTKILVAWIITSCQTCNELVEWLNLLKEKLQGKMFEWKFSCFIIEDGPQELQTLQWVLFSFH